MSEPLALTLGQKFELERMSRAIDATTDPQVLRGLAKQLLEAWHSQKAATQWMMRQHLGDPPRYAQMAGGAATPPSPDLPHPSGGVSPGEGNRPDVSCDS
ncbi:MAG: hypothetical protein ACK5QW_11560 [Cyanobacteriota bacterium]|jgi:hypothetical protein